MVTQTTPSRAKWLPSYQAVAAVPYSNIPPGIQTMTGCLAPRSADQILRFRQPSPGIVRSGSIAVICAGIGGFGGVGPKSRASRTPRHGAMSCGGRRRLGPTGGAAYGTPLKKFTPSALAPRTAPARVLTTGLVT